MLSHSVPLSCHVVYVAPFPFLNSDVIVNNYSPLLSALTCPMRVEHVLPLRAARAVRLVHRTRPPCTAPLCLPGMFTLTFVLTNVHDPRYAVRSAASAIAGFGSAACLAAVAYQRDDVSTMALFGASLAFLAVSNSGSFLVGNDLYPKQAGVCFGIGNTLGTIPGIISPIVAGHLLSNGHCPKDEQHHAETPQSCKEA